MPGQQIAVSLDNRGVAAGGALHAVDGALRGHEALPARRARRSAAERRKVACKPAPSTDECVPGFACSWPRFGMRAMNGTEEMAHPRRRRSTGPCPADRRTSLRNTPDEPRIARSWSRALQGAPGEQSVHWNWPDADVYLPSCAITTHKRPHQEKEHQADDASAKAIRLTAQFLQSTEAEVNSEYLPGWHTVHADRPACEGEGSRVSPGGNRDWDVTIIPIQQRSRLGSPGNRAGQSRS